jgi:conjugal transfer pilus assembly protein TraF
MKSFLYLGMLLAALPAWAIGDRAEFYEDRSRGWHWYETQPETTAPPPRPPAAPAEASTAPAFSAAWLRDALPRYRDLALDDPTPSNVELYYLLQRLTMDKAERFADVAGRVVAGNAFLDESNERPQTQLAKSAARRAQSKERAQASAALRALKVGYWYFFRSDCPFWHKQNPILEMLARESGVPLLPISLDGLPLADGAFPDFVTDEGQGAQLGVRVTPTLYLVRPPMQAVLVAAGVRTLDELEDRVLMVARDEGWISEDTYYAATRGTVPTFLSERVREEPRLEDDPARLLDALRQATRLQSPSGASPWTTYTEDAQ